jgi:hypothetical protein
MITELRERTRKATLIAATCLALLAIPYARATPCFCIPYVVVLNGLIDQLESGRGSYPVLDSR